MIYTPYQADDLLSRRNRPAVRRWTSAEEFDEAQEEGRQLLDIRKVYQPVFGVADPWIHTISVCPLGDVIARGLTCETTGFMGGDTAEMFVAGDAVYLWMQAASWDDRDWNSCPVGTRAPGFGEVPPAAVVRIPLGRGEARVMGARGMPVDQFGMDATGSRFRALPMLLRNGCDDDDTPQHFALLDAPQQRFRDQYFAASAGDFVPVPAVDGGGIENRFLPNHVLYGSRDRYSRRPPRDAEASERALANALTVVPLADPARKARQWRGDRQWLCR